jgi:hypothetical protein
MNPILEKMLIKQALPLLGPKVADLEKSTFDYLRQLPLLDGETHATAVLDRDTSGTHAVINIATFRGREYARTIRQIPVLDFIANLNSTTDHE